MKKMLTGSLQHVPFNLVTRLDVNVSNGINRAIKELQITKVVLGWNGKVTTVQNIFGGILENILPKNSQMMFVLKVIRPFSSFRQLVVMVPPHAEFEIGFEKWLGNLSHISSELNARLVFHADDQTTGRITAALDWMKSKADVRYVSNTAYGELEKFKTEVSSDDLFVIIAARERSISYDNSVSNFPRLLSKHYSDRSFILIYPMQYAFTHQDTTLRLDGLKSSLLQENITRISRLGKNVKKAIRGGRE